MDTNLLRQNFYVFRKLRSHYQFAILNEGSEGALSTLYSFMGGRAFGPPLCRGCAPATPPYKTIPHRPCVRIPAVRLQQRDCRQPNTQSDRLNGGKVKGLVKTGTVYGLVVTFFVYLKRRASSASTSDQERSRCSSRTRLW